MQQAVEKGGGAAPGRRAGVRAQAVYVRPVSLGECAGIHSGRSPHQGSHAAFVRCVHVHGASRQQPLHCADVPPADGFKEGHVGGACSRVRTTPRHVGCRPGPSTRQPRPPPALEWCCCTHAVRPRPQCARHMQGACPCALPSAREHPRMLTDAKTNGVPGTQPCSASPARPHRCGSYSPIARVALPQSCAPAARTRVRVVKATLRVEWARSGVAAQTTVQYSSRMGAARL